jgi:FMN phosphatase YigB (HAD superfamily)
VRTFEDTFDTQWYDYYTHAAHFGMLPSEVDALHYRFVEKVRFYRGARALIEKLAERGHNLFLMTGCNSQILKLRLKLYGLQGYFADRFISSDIAGELGSKEKYFESFFQHFPIAPKDLLFITDNYAKDVLPALMFHVATLYFAAGGRTNTAYNSHGIQPSDPIVLSLMCSVPKTAIEYPFSEFGQLLSVLDSRIP